MLFARLLPVRAVHILPFDNNIYKHIPDLCAPFLMSPHFWLKGNIYHNLCSDHCVLYALHLTTGLIFIEQCQYLGCYCKQYIVYLYLCVHNCFTDGSMRLRRLWKYRHPVQQGIPSPDRCEEDRCMTRRLS